MTYDNTNRGVLFVNGQKKSEKSPDYSGSLDVNGIQNNLSGWKKQSKKGTTFLSLSIQKKQEIEQKPPQIVPPMQTADVDPFGDEIPF